ncbi:hypothetical protein [Neobacillus soli]|uniref:hypothetical protein n=1 Tax=Neobacillus soli TaxID=220688 RepID=UPI000825DA45|nr:hypothetical protein [Neobacillus soli]
MGLVIYSVIAWLVLTVFFSLKKKLPNKINIIFYFVIQIVQINIFTITSFELKWFTINKNPVPFISVIINRDIILPVLLLLFVNMLFSTKQVSKRIVIAVVVFIIFAACEYLIRLLGFSHNHHWSPILYSAGMMIFSILTARLLMKIYSKEKKVYDGLSNL